ncbi:MAG: hypothetical protein Kow00107_09610 [Planctomycetota bacterium]
MTDQKENVGFESKLKDLEDILKKLESGTLPLEETMALYENGTALLKECYSILDSMEGRVVKLVRQADGSVKEERIDFDED